MGTTKVFDTEGSIHDGIMARLTGTDQRTNYLGDIGKMASIILKEAETGMTPGKQLFKAETQTLFCFITLCSFLTFSSCYSLGRLERKP